MGSIPTYSRQIEKENAMHSELLRNLPKVDDLLRDERIVRASCGLSHEQVADEIRTVIDEKRKAFLHSEILQKEAFLSFDSIAEEVEEHIRRLRFKSLRRVINATGVVLHTNLGRAKLSENAIAAVTEAVSGYSTLEYDPMSGKRGSRHVHTEELIRKITGAEAAMVVNNNAAATMLCLAALGKGREVVISRGELVEIGGSFRVPEIMEQSGAHLAEVGTTNKTRIGDYEKAIGENTGMLLKVHTSNYKIIGFTEDVSLHALREVADRHGLPLVYDMGSGLMTDLTEYGIFEPTVKDSLSAGADVVLFSGDKLLGGPQGGIIVGKKDYIDRMKKHPLARVLRIDKMTAAAMEAVFLAYYDEKKAKEEIPTLAMLTKNNDELYKEAELLKKRIDDLELGVETEVAAVDGMVGGGSAPDTVLKSWAVFLKHTDIQAAAVAEGLRLGEIPVIVRIVRDRIVIDVRTVTLQEQEILVQKLAAVMKERVE